MLNQFIHYLKTFHKDDIHCVSSIGKHTAIIIKPGSILMLADLAKKKGNFTYLVDILASDHFNKKNRFEVVYNFLSLKDKTRLFYKTYCISSSKPEIDSITSIWPSANWFEREAYDMYGIMFLNHPDMRRIYMPEDFEYYPLRKDFPLLGIPGSIPLPKSTAQISSNGDSPSVDDVSTTKNQFFKKHQEALYKSLEDKHTHIESYDQSDPFNTKIILNMGPQHPATHGVLRLVLQLKGEIIEKVKLDIGYLHRGVEKIAENKTYQEFMPYTDRMDYLAPYSNNLALCCAVEMIAMIDVPERAHYIRMIGAELSRISSHLLWLGTMIMDTGAISFFIWMFREREKIYDIFDILTGHRFTVSHCRIGGLINDMSDEAKKMIIAFLRGLEKELKDWQKLLNKNKIFFERNINIGTLKQENALSMGATGPVLRACGYAYDIRTFAPYARYSEVNFIVPTRIEGDNLARYYVRMEEMEQSIEIIKQCLDKLPKGSIRSGDSKKTYPSKDEVYYSMEGLIHDFMMTDAGLCPPANAECYHAVESPKGELGYFIQSDGTGYPWRMRIKTPSFANLQVMEYILDGETISDSVVIIGGMDPIMGDADK